jgi:mannose-6-phosphate isomerase-like protein (cupin superfamily)
MPSYYRHVRFDALPAQPWPCGLTRRAFLDEPDAPASVYRMVIKTDAETHKHMTGIYLILGGSDHVVLDGEQVPVQPCDAIMIHPGCQHRAVGKTTIVNVVMPPMDPSDEILVGEDAS